MRWALHILGLAALLAVASWSFSVTYRTKGTLDDISRLNREIAAEREALAVLKAEWAWLSAPDRLAALLKAEGAALGLEPMTPERFGEVAEAPLIEPDDGMDPVALIDLDAVSPEAGAPRRRAAARPEAAATAKTAATEPAPSARRAAGAAAAAAPVAASAAPLPLTPAAPIRAAPSREAAPASGWGPPVSRAEGYDR